MRPLTLLGAVVATLLASVLVPVTPAHAAPTTYTWRGAVSTNWGTPKNWEPEGIPQNGDAVILNPGPRATITDVQDVTLSSLAVTGSPDGAVSMSGDAHVITGSLQWNGGDINVDLTVSAPPLDPMPSYLTISQVPMRFGSGGDQVLTVNSTMSIMTGLAAGDAPWLTLMFDSSLRVASTGKLLLDPAARILGSRCCTNDTSTVIVDGTLEVFSAIGATGSTARLEQLGVDLAGDVVVPEGNRLKITGGPVRVGGHAINGTVGDARISGGGVVDIEETDGANYDAEHPFEPDGTMKFLEEGEELTIADETELRLGPSSEVSGIGSIVGEGFVRLAGTAIRGRLTLDKGVPAMTEPGTTSTVAVWERDLPAQTGLLTPAGGLRVEPGSTLRVQGGGGRLVVPKDANLTVPAGATLDSGSCCTDPGRVTLKSGSTLRIGQTSDEHGEDDPAVFRWLDLGGQGTVAHSGASAWDLAETTFTSGARITGKGTITGDLPAGPAEIRPSGVLTVDGDLTGNFTGVYRPTLPVSRTGTVAPSRLVVTGNAALAGRLAPLGDTTFNAPHRVVVLEAGTISGGYSCAVAGGMLMDTTATTVGLHTIDARVSDCLQPAPRAVLSATFSGARQVGLGLDDTVRSVLLDVKVSGLKRGGTLRLSAGRGTVEIQVPRRRAVTRQLEVPVAQDTPLTVRLSGRGKVTLGQVGYTLP